MDLASFCARERDGCGELGRRGDMVGEATGEMKGEWSERILECRPRRRGFGEARCLDLADKEARSQSSK